MKFMPTQGGGMSCFIFYKENEVNLKWNRPNCGIKVLETSSLESICTMFFNLPSWSSDELSKRVLKQGDYVLIR